MKLDGRFWKWWHFAFMVAWLLMVPTAFITHLASSVPFVTFLSLWALFATEHGAWQGSRAEVKAEDLEIETDHATVGARSVTVGVDARPKALGGRSTR